MAVYGHVEPISMLAATDLSGKQYHILRLSGSFQVNIASHAAGAPSTAPFGVLLNKPNSGHAASVCIEGEMKVVTGGAISAGALITCNGSGRAIAASSGDNVIGTMIETAVNDGDLALALIERPRFVTPM